MPLNNDIALRPRFKMEIPRYNEAILSDFENAKTTQSSSIARRAAFFLLVFCDARNLFFSFFIILIYNL